MTAADQRAFWNGKAATKWSRNADHFERAFQQVNAALLDFANLTSGLAVLDVGCGVGNSTGWVWQAVHPGRVMGIDISVPLIAEAKTNLPEAAFVAGDAARFDFAPEFDLVYSRLGVMFFEEPAVAFANLRRALKPGGRLAFVCWRKVEEVEAFYRPYRTARDLLPAKDPAPINTPGPFGLADGDRIQTLLEQTGWQDIEIRPVAPAIFLGDTLEEAADQALLMGPLYRASGDLSDDIKAQIRVRLLSALASFQTAEGVALPAACWLVGARNTK